jgi:acyl-[acyl-carrier-protein]-phospholipid O-acyltransferase/long-chain-fatty-acid--[acyl-carrier-protein] ligase
MQFYSAIGGEIVAFIARTLLRLFYRAEVKGTLPRSGRMLIVANHQSFLDGVIIGAFLPVTPTYMIHSTIARKWYFKWPLMFIRHVIVDTQNPLSVKTLINAIEQGEPVVIFPEGRITVTGSMMKIYDGPAFVAAKTGCNIVPLHIDGPVYSTLSRMSGDFPQKLFPKITMTIHRGECIGMPVARTAKLRRRAAAEALRRVMQKSAYESRTRTTLYDAFLDAVELHGKDRRIIEDINGQPASYATAIKASLALGRLVSRLSDEGETVGVLMPNVNATVYLLLGMFAMRRTPGMLNFTSGVEGLQNACRVAKMKTIITSRAFIEKAKLGDTVGKLTGVDVVYLEDLRKRFGLLDKLWLILWAVRRPRRIRRRAQPEDPAVVLFTSGSEGTPKGVVLSHDSILSNIEQIKAAFPFSSKDKFMSALPVFHAFGLTAGILLPLFNGVRIFVYPSPLHYRVVPEVVYDRDCTVLFSTNTFLANYAKFAHPYDFYNVRYLVVGAEKLTEDVQKLCLEKFGLRVLEGYGATECAPVIAVNTPFAARFGTVGELLPGMEGRTVPLEGIDEGGVLHVKGDNMMLGYLKSDQPGIIQPPSSELGPGWYNTGDVVTLDEGFVRIQGRIKRFAKVAGEMVSLDLVEKIAQTARPEALHAATAIRDTARGETILLFTQDSTLRREDLVAAVRAMGAPEIAVPRRIVFVDKIPVLGTGKKDYVALSRMAPESAGARS